MATRFSFATTVLAASGAPAADAPAEGSMRKGQALQLLGRPLAKPSFLGETSMSKRKGSAGSDDPAIPTSAFEAAKWGNAEALKVILDANATPVDRSDKQTPLHAAAFKGHLDCLKLLLDANVDPNALDVDLRSPTMMAARGGHSECLRLLVEAGADVNMANESGMTPLFRACELNHISCLQILLDADADVDQADDQGRTPIYVAAQLNNHLVLEHLIAQSDPGLRQPSLTGRTPLNVARRMRNFDSAAVLALATLEFDAQHDEVLPDRQRGLTRPDPRPPVAILSTDARELEKLVHGDKIRVSLPYCFVRRPLDTCYAVIELVAGLKREETKVTKVDELGGQELLDASFKIQQVLICMLDSLDETEFTTLMLPSGGNTSLLDAAITASCKMFLSYPRLQKLIQDRWNLALPSDVISFAAMQWWNQDVAGDAVGKPPRRLVAPPTLRGLYVRQLRAIVYNVMLIFGEALYPPLADANIHAFDQAKEKARKRVRLRNPEPLNFDDKGQKSYYLDGVLMGVTVQSNDDDTDQDREERRAIWSRMLAAVAEDEARLEEFDQPLFQPCGTFLMHATSKFLLAFLLTILPAIGEAHIPTLLFLLLYSSQLAIQEIDAILKQYNLWNTDFFNKLELASTSLISMALVARLYVELEAAPKEPYEVHTWEYDLAHGSQSALGIGIAFQWVAQWCRLLQASSLFGPLILMAFELIKDCFNFLVLLSGVFLAFGVALVTLLKPVHLGHWSPKDHVEDLCEELFADGYGLSAVLQAAVALLKIVLGADSSLSDCFGSNANASLVMDGFRGLVMLMALNMLIAQMSTTYERIRERLTSNFMYLTALVITTAMNEARVPAPLGMLSLPFLIGSKLSNLLACLRGVLSRCTSSSAAHVYKDVNDADVKVEEPSSPNPQLSTTESTQLREWQKKLRQPKRLAMAEAESNLRESVIRTLEGQTGAAEDDRWKSRQTRQLASVQQEIKDTFRDLVPQVTELMANADAYSSNASNNAKSNANRDPTISSIERSIQQQGDSIRAIHEQQAAIIVEMAEQRRLSEDMVRASTAQKASTASRPETASPNLQNSSPRLPAPVRLPGPNRVKTAAGNSFSEVTL